MLHGRWNDHLNVAGFCVVWGHNTGIDLQAFDFCSGQFTCFFRTDDPTAWRSFSLLGRVLPWVIGLLRGCL